jgi:hypothetical protein
VPGQRIVAHPAVTLLPRRGIRVRVVGPQKSCRAEYYWAKPVSAIRAESTG